MQEKCVAADLFGAANSPQWWCAPFAGTCIANSNIIGQFLPHIMKQQVRIWVKDLAGFAFLTGSMTGFTARGLEQFFARNHRRIAKISAWRHLQIRRVECDEFGFAFSEFKGLSRRVIDADCGADGLRLSAIAGGFLMSGVGHAHIGCGGIVGLLAHTTGGCLPAKTSQFSRTAAQSVGPVGAAGVTPGHILIFLIS